MARVEGRGPGLPGVIVVPQFFVEVSGRRLNKAFSSLIAASEEAQRLHGSVVPA